MLIAGIEVMEGRFVSVTLTLSAVLKPELAKQGKNISYCTYSIKIQTSEKHGADVRAMDCNYTSFQPVADKTKVGLE